MANGTTKDGGQAKNECGWLLLSERKWTGGKNENAIRPIDRFFIYYFKEDEHSREELLGKSRWLLVRYFKGNGKVARKEWIENKYYVLITVNGDGDAYHRSLSSEPYLMGVVMFYKESSRHRLG